MLELHMNPDYGKNDAMHMMSAGLGHFMNILTRAYFVLKHIYIYIKKMLCLC